MTLEEVWKVLGNGQWESTRTLSWASGLDDARIGRIINFLDRWDFAETRNAPDLQVRQKPGATSPVEVISQLRAIANQSQLHRRLKLAERVACRECGERKFNFLGNNQVECVRCHEKQWYSIELNENVRGLGKAETERHPRSLMKRLLVRIGFPQEAC